VERIGYLKHKDFAIERKFRLLSVCFILSGNGILKIAGETFKLEAPFIMFNIPGEDKFYKPDGHWEELFLGFDIGAEEEFHRRFSAILSNQPFYKIKDISLLHTYITIIQELMEKPAVKGVVDQIDNLANLLILESILPSQIESHSTTERNFLKAIHWINSHFLNDIDLKELAEKNNLSYPTFRRLWRKKFQFSPLQYIQKLKNSEARVLLTESNLSIADIAEKTGFRNQFYFSNFFRRYNGMSPSCFKKKYGGQ
jgi:AraC-like DNA-binding protein